MGEIIQKTIAEMRVDLEMMFGDTPPSIVQLVELIRIRKAARSLLMDVTAIVSRASIMDFAAAEAMEKQERKTWAVPAEPIVE